MSIREPRIPKSIACSVVISLLFSLSFSISALPLTTLQPSTSINSLPALQDRRDNILWDNGNPGFLVIASQLDTNVPFNSQSADDFLFDNDTDIHGVGWYGGYYNGESFDSGDFIIYFYYDDGSGLYPTGGGLENPETTAVQSYQFDNVVGEQIIDSYYYEVQLDPPFQAQQGQKYWIVFQIILDFPPQWGWHQTNDQLTLSPAVQGFPPSEIPFWTDIVGCYGPVDDLAFYLFGEDTNPEEPPLEITEILGGDQLSITITNPSEIAISDTSLTVMVEGGLYVSPRNVTFSDITIPSGSDYTKSVSLFGVGLGLLSDPLIITIILSAPSVEEVRESVPATLFIRWITLNE